MLICTLSRAALYAWVLSHLYIPKTAYGAGSRRHRRRRRPLSAQRIAIQPTCHPKSRQADRLAERKRDLEKEESNGEMKGRRRKRPLSLALFVVTPVPFLFSLLPALPDACLSLPLSISSSLSPYLLFHLFLSPTLCLSFFCLSLFFFSLLSLSFSSPTSR